MDYRIDKGEPYWSNIDYTVVEKVKNARWVADLPVRLTSGGWSEEPVAVFWQANPPDGFGAYFGLYMKQIMTFTQAQLPVFVDDGLRICSAMSAVDGDIEGMMAKNGDVLFSRYRHDCRRSTDGTAMVDGGRDYLRGFGMPVRLRVDGPDLVLVMDNLARAALERVGA